MFGDSLTIVVISLEVKFWTFILVLHLRIEHHEITRAYIDCDHFTTEDAHSLLKKYKYFLNGNVFIKQIKNLLLQSNIKRTVWK